jgi:hypothetical protein
MIKVLKNKFEQPIAIEPLVSFRILFGLCLFYSTARFIALGWVQDHFSNTLIHFPFLGFEWLKPLTPNVMLGIHYLMLLASLGITLGAFYRISTLLFFLCFTYTFLLDSTYYLNHYYFVILVVGTLFFLPAHKKYSIDSHFNITSKSDFIAAYHIYAIYFHIGLVYFFAGIAKLNSDWLFSALPLKIWLPSKDYIPIIGSLMTKEWVAYVFSWVGMVFDISVVFLLLYSKTRGFAYFLVVVFHSLTGLFFQIGIFPIVMIASTLIFFSTKFHKKFLQLLITPLNLLFRINLKKNDKNQLIFNLTYSKFVIILIYIAIQLAIPFRHIAYPGNLFWTEQGYRFSWRVMLMEKAGTAQFYVHHPKTGVKQFVDNSEFLNAHQEKQLAFQPDMMLYYAKFLADSFTIAGYPTPKITADVYVTLNAKPSQRYISDTSNLAQVKNSFRHKSFILPQE